MVDLKNLYLCFYCNLPGYWSLYPLKVKGSNEIKMKPLCPVCVEKRKLNEELCI